MRIAVVVACVLVGGTATAGPKQKAAAKDACGSMTPSDCVAAAGPLELGVDMAGKAIKKDLKGAAAMYRSACDARYAPGCAALAEMGWEAKLDDAAVLKLRRTACDLDTQECWSLALELKEREDAASRAETKKLLTSMCNSKERQISLAATPADACYVLADISPRGENVGWYRRACEGGRDEGCTHLAQIYLNDEDPKSDAAASTRALETMCKAGSAIACSFAADRHFAGKGTTDSGHAGADPWMIKACDLGDLQTCTARGRGMLFDAKTDAERATAKRMLKKACDAHDQNACDWLARAK